MSKQAASSEANRDSQPSAAVKWPVLYGSGIGVLLIVLWSITAPDTAMETVNTLVGWTSEWFGWYYILLATVIFVFVLFLAFSRYGQTKLGPEHSKPEHGTITWTTMLFAAGIGIDLMFFAVAGPVTQYLAPPADAGETIEAAREATVWTTFHYGISGWAMYALMGMALGYFSYRRNLPLAIRSALYPIFGKRIHGAIGHSVDLAAVLGTIFGVGASLGIGVVQLNFGLHVLFGLPEGYAAQIGLIALAAAVATISAVSGIDRGIKLLSQLNVLFAIGLAAYVLIAGKTTFLLNGLVLNIGDFVSSFPGLTMETFAFDRPEEWLNSWTLFFWAWWIAWAPFVGLFLARISRGRTIRQFVAGTMIIPFGYIIMWVSIFGNSAIDRIRSGDAAFGELAMNTPEHGFYTLLMDYPAFPVIGVLATVVGLLFYITSADSGALVLGNLTSHLPSPNDDAGKGMRIFWGVTIGLLTAAMLVLGGIPVLQSTTIIIALPSSFVLILVMVGLYRALRVEANRATSQRQNARRKPGEAPDGNGTVGWRARLSHAMAFPDEDAAREFLKEVGMPALREIAGELREQGVQARATQATDDLGEGCVEMTTDLSHEHPFRYQICLRTRPIPGYVHRARGSEDVYFRLEVHLDDGGQGYDVMGYTHSQLIDDVLDQYERHLEFLRLQELASRTAVPTPTTS